MQQKSSSLEWAYSLLILDKGSSSGDRQNFSEDVLYIPVLISEFMVLDGRYFHLDGYLW